MSKQFPRPLRPKALAIPLQPPLAKDARLLAWIHLLLAMMIPLLILAISGCMEKDEGEPIDFGPPVSGAALDEALLEPLMTADVLSMKPGQFVHFAATQSYGKIGSNLLADVAQTIVEKQDTPTDVTYTVVQHVWVYNQNEAQKTSTEFKLGFEKDTSQSAAKASSVSDITRLSVPKSPLAMLQAGLRKLDADRKLGLFSTDGSAHTMADRVTFHGLKTSVRHEPPPEAVRNQPNCLGIPNCLLKVYHVEFDQVIWKNGEGDRVHFDMAMSPEAPMLAGHGMSPVFEYYPGLLKTCLTMMAPVGDGRSKILMTQCNQVENFRYESTPEPTSP